MLDAPEAFFFCRGYNLTIAEQTGCRIAVVGVETEKKQKTYPSSRGSAIATMDWVGGGMRPTRNEVGAVWL